MGQAKQWVLTQSEQGPGPGRGQLEDQREGPDGTQGVHLTGDEANTAPMRRWRSGRQEAEALQHIWFSRWGDRVGCSRNSILFHFALG